MGLRTASVRHPHVEVMAPALTETNQTQSFKLQPDNQSASPVNKSSATTCRSLPNGRDRSDADVLKASGTPIMSDCPDAGAGDDHHHHHHHHSKMGLQKVLDDISDINEMDGADAAQFLSALPTGEEVADDLMMDVFTDAGASDTDQMFGDAALTLGEENALGDDLFNVMNMSIDDPQQQVLENVACVKQGQAKERLAESSRLHARLERRVDFLLRRMRKFQLRRTGKHVSAEMAGVFEHVQRQLMSDGESTTESSFKPMSCTTTRTLLKKLEPSNGLLTAGRPRNSKYFGAGSAEVAARPPAAATSAGFAMPAWATEEKTELQTVAGLLESELRLLQEEVDSEATVSSSGGESCDEAETFNNLRQQTLPINKRAVWRYELERSAVACRWTWLQSQIADLDYKIRQHVDLAKMVRHSKEPVKLGGANPPHVAELPTCLNGYRGPLPGAATIYNGDSLAAANGAAKTALTDYQSARTRPLVGFRKRKLLQLSGLHVVSKKAARPATTLCGCTPPENLCALCTGRTDPTHPRGHFEYLSRDDIMGLLDPSYHPVLSLNDVISASIHMEAIMQTPDWQLKSTRTKSQKYKGDRMEKGSNADAGSPVDRPRVRNVEHRKKYNRLIKPSTANALTAKIKNRYRGRKPMRPGPLGRLKKRPRMSSAHSLGSDGADDEVEALRIIGGKYESPSSSPLLTQAISGSQKRYRIDSYDIDNIIIPYSVASSMRVEILQYKEIPTPKWRIVTTDDLMTDKANVKNNGNVTTSQDQEDDKEDFEDLSDSAVLIRHEKCEQDERKKFLNFLKVPIGYGRARLNRRTDSLAESSGANTPDPLSPAPPPPSDLPASMTIDKDNTYSPPVTPTPEEVPSIAVLRRRNIFQAARVSRDTRDERRSASPEPEVPPYDKRTFPLSAEAYDNILRGVPEEPPPPKVKPPVVLIQDQRSLTPPPLPTVYKRKDEHEHDSESTESAFGDEDPNDPEWDGTEIKERFVRFR